MMLPGADFPTNANVWRTASSEIYWVTPSQINRAGLAGLKAVPEKTASTVCVSKSIGELCRNTEKEITTANLWHDMGVEAYHTRKEAVCCAVYHQHSALAHPFCPMCRRWCSSYLASFSNPFWPGSVIWSIAWSSCAVPAIRSSSWLNSMTSLQL